MAGEEKVLTHFFVSSSGLSKTQRNPEPNMNVMLKDHKKMVFWCLGNDDTIMILQKNLWVCCLFLFKWYLREGISFWQNYVPCSVSSGQGRLNNDSTDCKIISSSLIMGKITRAECVCLVVYFQIVFPSSSTGKSIYFYLDDIYQNPAAPLHPSRRLQLMARQ